MIKYNSNTISEWSYGSDNIVKVYRNNAVCYYKVINSGGTPTYQVCYAVVDDISQYTDTEFVDVYDKATEKWYKLNNLNQYEEYGVYGSGRSITYYQGKLTIDDGYEYQYSGSSWVNVGEVSGGTASLPDVAFSVNYNANNYDANTKTLLKTSGQLVDVDAVITAGTPTVHDGYLTIASGTRATISGYQTYFNRDNSNPNLTIISKQRTDGTNCHMFANRDSSYNWMYRVYATKLTLHGSSETGQLAVSTQPVIEAARVYDNRTVKYNNYTNNTTSSASSFNYGSTNSTKFAMFQGYATTTGENFVGDFYWVYMSQNTLTDEQIQQVIGYNEGGGGEPTYPLYYDEKQEPLNNLSFSSMTEANEYAYNNCVYVGENATIDGTRYIFSGDSTSGYEWTEITTPYTELTYIQCSTTSSRGGVQLLNTPKEGLLIEIDFELSGTTSNSDYEIIGQKDKKETVSYQMGFMQYNSWSNGFYDYGGGRLSLGSCPSFTTRRTWKIGRISGSTSPSIVGYYCEGTFKTNNVSTLQFDANRPYNIGNIGYNGSSTPELDSNTIKQMKLYSVKIYEDYGETLVGDYIPVIKEDGTTVTLYDKVSGNYANPVGTIIAGDLV